MDKNILRNAVILVGTVVAAFFILRALGVGAHKVGNVAQHIEGKV